MNNIRFATALHIVTLLAKAEGPLSSAYLAGSINVHAAVVRKEVSNLKAHGLVMTKEGKGGGITLARPAAAIRLSAIYKAVSEVPLLGKNHQPNPACPVGRQINQHLSTIYSQAETALLHHLGETNLAAFVNRFE